MPSGTCRLFLSTPENLMHAELETDHTEFVADAQQLASVEAILAELVTTTSETLGDDLLSIVLFGSAAEGRLRANSDVNVLMLLKTFTSERIDLLREYLRLAHSAARV